MKMCSKNVILSTKRTLHLHNENLRWLSRRWMSNRSYLHNRGSEPLIYATLGDQFAKAAHKYPDRIAVKSVYENISITYEQLLSQADSLGCALRAQGLAAGDKVGIWSHNSASWIVTLVAVARAGLISVLINPVYEKPEISYCIKKAQLKALLIGDKLPKKDYYNMLTQLIPELQNSKPGLIKSNEYPLLNSIVHSGKENLPGASTIDSLIADYKSGKDQITKYGSEVEPDDGSVVHFTSGTTGKPKAPLDSHFGVVNNAYFIGKRQQYNEEHQIICVQAPLFHALGSVVTTLAGLTFGSTLVLPAPFYNLEANTNALYSEKCTSTNGTPTMYVDLLKYIKSKGLDPPNLKLALAAGAPCSPHLIRDIKKYLNADTVKGLYGLSETTAGVFHSNIGDTVDQVAETVGYIQDHVEVKVVNSDGKTVPFGTPGELMVRGYLNMIGYLDDPEKTKEVIAAGGWLKTGDKFTISEDGYGRIVGRLKDIIVRGGENIAPKEVEDVLNTHPDILESQVVGVADERLGEELCVVLILHEGATFTHEDLKKYLTGRLAKFKIPKILKITDSFPKTTSGKIQKYKLKELVESGKI